MSINPTSHITLGTTPHGFDPDVRLTKEAAIAAGAIAYWPGKPCGNDHMAHRYVASRECVVCAARRRKHLAYKVVRDEARAAGIDPALRRKAEEVREQRRLERELDGWEL